ncbi:MAG: bile acid:sodium symporter family protein [Leptolyngbya sp. DLM2.Bin27]|nr:MAG: bile acid:sodium symporter family protein [Leptolyngbya sp. DLM2.Bin27]
MESTFLTAVLLPLALFAVMLGMGLGLKLEDFTRVLVYPKAVVVGLLAQLLLLPILGFVLASVFPLSPELAVGVMILAACPGGPTSNLVTYLARGNVALSITLTAISSLVTVFTIPLVVNLATGAFMGEATSLQLPFVATVLQIAVITMIPVAVGMALHHYLPQTAARLERGVKGLSLALLGLIIAGLLVQQRASVVSFFAQVGLVALTLNLAAMALGYLIARVAKLGRASATAITVEVGMQNGTLAIAIASAPTLLNQPNLAIPAAIYSLLMLPTGGLFAWWATGRSRPPTISAKEETPL